MKEKEEVKIGVDMEEYSTSKKLIRFKLRTTSSSLVGTSRMTSSGEIYKILGSVDKKCNFNKYPYFLIEFEDGIREVVSVSSITLNNLKNPNTPSVYNIGFMGQGIYTSVNYPKEYKTWRGMLERCYSEAFQITHPNYIGCSVHERWHNFQNFCEDIQHLEGYREWKVNSVSRAYALDKDIKIEHNREYSKDACMFVTTRGNVQKARVTGKTYLATFVETGYTERFKNQSKFARDNGINQGNMHRSLGNKDTQTGGWTFEVVP